MGWSSLAGGGAPQARVSRPTREQHLRVAGYLRREPEPKLGNPRGHRQLRGGDVRKACFLSYINKSL